MPLFEIEEENAKELEFEVFCSECGKGICLDTRVRKSRIRSMPQIEVFCSYCHDAHKKQIKELEDTIKELEYKIRELE